MNKADLILKENDRLRKDNELLIKEAENAKRTAIIEKDQIKNQYRSYFDEVAQKETVVLQKEKIADEKLKNIRAYIGMEAREKAKIHRRLLEKKFRAKALGYQTYVISALLYGLLVTVFTAIKTKQIVDDCVEFFSVIRKGILTALKYLYQFSVAISSLAKNLPNGNISIIIHWLIITLIMSGVTAGIGIAVFKLVIWIKDYYAEHLMDKVTLAALLLNLSLIVFFGKEIRQTVHINLILLSLLFQIIYAGIRDYVRKWEVARWS